MKFKDEYNVERSGLMGETAFGMRATGKAFELLTAKLYSDRIGSVVRELSANAFDAHKAAGREDVPFDISVPFSLDPTFVVKDYGTGLAPADLERLFGTVFESTKDQSDDYIGAFGLGSKSPFSLTDSYVVEGRWEGKIYSYLIFKNEQKMPSILQTGVTDTDEPNGITIKVPISDSYYADFIRSIKAQLFLFEVKPNVLNARNWEWYNVQPQSQHDKTRLYDPQFKNQVRGDSMHYVSMGKVMYPLDMSSLDSGVRSKLCKINSVSITEFPIGALDILPSREGLSYDEPTIKNLNEYFTRFFPLYDESIFQEIRSCKNNFDAWKRWKYLRETEPYWRDMKDMAEGPNGTTITYSMYAFVEEYLEFEVERLDLAAWNLAKETNELADKLYKKEIEKRTAFESVLGRRSSDWRATSIAYDAKKSLDSVAFNLLHGALEGNKIFVLVDEPKNIQKKIKHLFDSGVAMTSAHVYMIHKRVGEKGETVGFEKFLEAMEQVCPGFSDKVLLLSALTFPKPVVTPKTKTEKIEGVFKVQLETLHRNYTQRREVENLGDIIPGMPFVTTNRGCIEDWLGFSDIASMDLKYLLPFMKSDVVLYDITATAKHRVEKLKSLGLVPFREWLDNHFKNGERGNILKYLVRKQYLIKNGHSDRILANLNILASRFPEVEVFKKGSEVYLDASLVEKPETDLDAIFKWLFSSNAQNYPAFADSGLNELIAESEEALKEIEKPLEVYSMLEYTIGHSWNFMIEDDMSDEDNQGPNKPNGVCLNTLDYIHTLNNIKGF